MSADTNKTADDLVAKSGLFAGTNVKMAAASMVMILGFVIFTVYDTDFAGEVFGSMKTFIVDSLGWYYVLLMNVIMFFVIYLMFSRFGHVKLGPDDCEPDFSTFSWICMLFSAGLGSGLIYWGVAEPIFHFQSNPFMETAGIETGTPEAALSALTVTNFHWGFHGWAIYVMVGLSLAYFGYRRGLPLTLRSALYPILKGRIYGRWGDLVDLIGVFGTVFGLATSLGMGVVPITAGLSKLTGIENDITTQLIVIACITVVGTASAVSGVGKGVRILSEVNVWFSLLLVFLFLILGPTGFILGMIVSSAGDYLWNFIPMGFWLDGHPDRQWQSWWTIFYWAWWLAWCPFVGLFIARISRGRTLREFCTCVFLVPTTVVVIWMGIFGGGSLGMELFWDAGISAVTNANYAEGAFQAFNNLSVDWLITPVTILAEFLLISWFVTSSDSGTLVVCTILSMGNDSPPIKLRVFWGITSGFVASVLLLAGGLNALQTASIVAGLPMSLILIGMMVSVIKGLEEDFPAPDVEDTREKIYLNR